MSELSEATKVLQGKLDELQTFINTPALHSWENVRAQFVDNYLGDPVEASHSPTQQSPASPKEQNDSPSPLRRAITSIFSESKELSLGEACNEMVKILHPNTASMTSDEIKNAAFSAEERKAAQAQWNRYDELGKKLGEIYNPLCKVFENEQSRQTPPPSQTKT